LIKSFIVLLLLLLLGCESDAIEKNESTLILLLSNDNELVHKQDTGIPFKKQDANEREFRKLDARRIGVIDISNDQVLILQVYQGQPCVAKPAYAIVDCFSDSGEIFQRFGMGRGQGLGEMESVNRYALNDSGYAMLADVIGRNQKLINLNNDEILQNVTFPLEDVAETIGSAGNDKFAFSNGLYLTESSIQYFEKQIDGTWTKIQGPNLYDQDKPMRPSQLSDNARAEISRELVAAPTVFRGIMDGHSDGDFIIATMKSGLLVRLDGKKASWVRNMITNPMSGSIEMATAKSNLPAELRPAYSPPFYYLPKLIDRRHYTYALKVQDGHIINIDFIASDRRVIFDFYAEFDGSYLHSYEFVAGTSLTYLGIQLSGNRLYILNGNGEIIIFEVEFL